MWILPKNYPLSSAFAADMVESREDLSLPGLNIESSLMWRSKPSPLRTWLTRWKTGSYLPHLYTRILKPSHRKSFEEKLASSLAAIHVNLSQQQEKGSEQMTQDTCGPTYGDTSQQLDLLNASLKTSRDTSRLDSPASSAIWKKMVIEARGEYSQRVKLAHRTRESESTSWATPTCHMEKEGAYPAEFTRNTPSLTAQANWPTPDVAQAQKVSNRPNYGQLGLANHPKVHGKNVDRPKMCKDRNGLPGQIKNNTNGNSQEQFGKLNPNWVEHLMGIPTEWTDLGSWGTESYQQQPPKRG